MSVIFRRLNLLTGLLSFGHFIYTGIYLVNKSDIKDDYWHMSTRSNHIYLLMISLINLLFYKIENINSSLLDKISNIIVSLSAILCCFGFFRETGEKIENRMLVPMSVGLIFFGVILKLIIPSENKNKKME